jgi:hypothetical protein
MRGVDVGDHLKAIVNETVAGSLRTGVGTTPCRALSGKDTNPFIAEFLVSTKEVADLATTSSLADFRSELACTLDEHILTISPAGTSVSAPMWRESSCMKA